MLYNFCLFQLNLFQLFISIQPFAVIDSCSLYLLTKLVYQNGNISIVQTMIQLMLYIFNRMIIIFYAPSVA